jgi:hypothetical protein
MWPERERCSRQYWLLRSSPLYREQAEIALDYVEDPE